jgi:hypothetical protein
MQPFGWGLFSTRRYHDQPCQLTPLRVREIDRAVLGHQSIPSTLLRRYLCNQAEFAGQNLLFRTISRAATPVVAMAIVLGLMVVLTKSSQAQTFKVIYNFTGGPDGAYPYAGLTMDAAGNLYGTANGGGDGKGTVFKLAPESSVGSSVEAGCCPRSAHGARTSCAHKSPLAAEEKQ